ncbi:MAG: cell division protein FtsX [Cyclobacteriaceae bacterium]|nr:MAG: cell division protein FtsX [Cyclobacteriaceae bacterium]
MNKKKFRKKKKLGSYPYLSVVFSITLALFVMGLFGLLFIHSHKLSEYLKEQMEVQVYLENQLSESRIIGIQQTLASKEFTLVKDNEPQLTFITKEQALEDFTLKAGENPEEFLGHNPLRNAYLLKLKPEYLDSLQLAQVKTEIESINGVFEVSYLDSIIADLNKNTAKIGMILIGFFIVLLLTVVILINNTIKLALFSQRFLIRSMQLVGATGGFIQRPFLWRSMAHGLLAGILASVFLFGLLEYARFQIPDLNTISDLNKVLILFLSLIFIGALIGFFSTLRAIRRYLKMSLDELY